MSRYNDLQRLDKPPLTRQLQRHFGLSRKEAVRFHKEYDSTYNADLWEAGKWHTHTFKLVDEIKNKRQARKHKEVPSV
jgi:hypothetical protein